MKKQISLVFILLTIALTSIAQVGISINGTPPDASAMLDIKSTLKGLLTPRMTAAQRTIIAAPATGLIVYQTDGSSGFYYFNGSTWLWLGGSNLTGSGNSGQVSFWTGPGSQGGNSNFFWDNTNGRLGIGITTPVQQLEITSSFSFPATTSSTTGIIYKGTSPFIHDFKPALKTGQNTFVGTLAGNFTMTGNTSDDGSNNTALGHMVLNGLMSGNRNTAVGSTSMALATTGHENTAVGFNTLYSNLLGSYNTAIGSGTLSNNTASDNTAIGCYALGKNTTGNSNVFVGKEAGAYNQTGSYNSALGYSAGSGVSLNSFSGNCLFGYKSGEQLSTGSNNILIGYQAGNTITSGSGNIIIGYDIDPPISGNDQIVLGAADLFYGNLATKRIGIGTTTPGQQLEITGSFSLPATTSSTTGIIFKGTSPFIHDFKPAGKPGQNTFVGILAGNFAMTGPNSYDASNNTALGYMVLNGLANGNQNTAVGSTSMALTTGGTDNTAVGFNTLSANLTGNYNTAIGSGTLSNNTASGNTAIGCVALANNTTGHSNVFVGQMAGIYNQTGYRNAALGYSAGSGVALNSFSKNCLFGYKSGEQLSTGSNNILIGYQAGNAITSGSGNIIIGDDIDPPSATGSNQIVLGAADLFYGDIATKRIGIGTATPGQKLTVDGTFGILEGGASPTHHTIFQGGTQPADITYTLPVDDGTTGQALTSDGTGILSWSSVGSLTGAGTAYRLAYWAGSNSMTSSANLNFDPVNSRLGIGTASPNQQLEITGSFTLPATTSSTTGIIFKGTSSFIHDYKPAANDGSNTFVGIMAGNFTMAGASNYQASYNTGVGYLALNDLTTGFKNTSAGYNAMAKSTTGYNNTAIGYSALSENLTGYDNLALGASALSANTGSSNTAVGSGAQYSNTSGGANVIVGTSAAFYNQTGSYNAILGFSAGQGAVSNSYSGNCLFGYMSGLQLSTGSNNILIGYQAGNAITSGSGNIIIGYDIDPPSSGSNQIVVGAVDLFYGNLATKRIGIGTATPGQKLTVDGTFGILEGGASPTHHTIFQGGTQPADITYTLPVDDGITGQVLTSDGTGILSWSSVGSLTGAGTAYRLAYWAGSNSLTSNANLNFDPVNSRLGIGTASPSQQLELTGNLRLPASTATTGIIYAGANPFIHNFGTSNIFLGQSCGNLALTGTGNTATGNSTLNSITSGSYNVASGYQALELLTSSSGNIAIGYGAGRGIVSPAGYNTIVGYRAGLVNNTDRNTFFGCETGLANTTGHYNVFIGHQAGSFSTVANNCVAVGYRALYSQTGDLGANTAVGYSANIASANLENVTVIGNSAIATVSNQVRLGNDAITSLYCMGAYDGTVGSTPRDLYADMDGKIGYIASSARYKENIFDMESSEWFYKLRPVNFTYKSDEQKKKQYGLIAEEVEMINPAFVSYNKEGVVETVTYSQLISPMIKAIQEHQKTISDLQSQVDALKTDREMLISRLESLEKKLFQTGIDVNR